MPQEVVEFKDITFTLDKFGKLEAEVERGPWSLFTTNESELHNPDIRSKPRSFSLPSNQFSNKAIRRFNFKPQYRGETAGNISIQEYEDYVFVFDMVLKDEYRGKGGGTFLMDLFKAVIVFTDKGWVGGFVGDGNTESFIRSQGFSRAQTETWTNNVWSNRNVSGEFTLDQNYYNIPEEDRFGLVPTPTDIVSEHGHEAIELRESNNSRWTVQEEEIAIEEKTPKGIKAREGEIIFDSRVRADVAQPFWTRGYSTWFKIHSRKVEYGDSIFPITSRNAPVLDRFRDPTYSIFDV